MNWITELTIALGILQLFDFYTTRTIISCGGYEQNPVMAKVFSLIGVDTALVIKGILVTVIGWIVGQQSIFVLGALVALYAAVIVHNWKSMPGGNK